MRKPARLQVGLTLMEMMIAMVISLVAALAMVSLMANTLGTGTRTIQMTRLTSELRAALQIMTRDVRRANYHGNFVKCFGNVSCRSTLDNGDGDVTAVIKAVTLDGSDCFYYWFDRDSDGDVTSDDAVGAFRLGSRSGTGTIEMTTTLETTPDCDDAGDWTPITNPDSISITGFSVDNNLSYTDTISGNHAQRIDKIRMRITGVLVADNSITRTVEDIIRVRNDVYTPAP